jgi:membrane protein DedA with SNARE-associated domain
LSLQEIGWYLSIFFWLYFTGIGIPPFPEEGGIAYAAYLTAVHDLHWWWAWPATGAGIMGADMTLYGIGRLFGPRLFEYRWVKRLVKPERRQRFESMFHSHGFKVLLTARLLPPLRTGIFIVAGAVSFSFVQFLIADTLYAIFGVGLMFFFGAGIMTLVHSLDHWAVYGVVAVVLAYLVYHFYKRLKTREVRISAPEPITIPAPASIIEAVQDTVPARPPGEPVPEPTPAPAEITSLVKQGEH